MLTDDQVKEHLALAYVYAVATKVKCSFEVTRVDMDSIDVRLALKNDADPDPEIVFRSPEISIQVKGHSMVEVPPERFSYPLTMKNYDDLRKRSSVPRLLVVVTLPPDPKDFLTLDDDQLLLRRCGYWLNLADAPDSDNTTKQTVHMQRAQRFDPDSLERLMRCTARQERLQ